MTVPWYSVCTMYVQCLHEYMYPSHRPYSYLVKYMYIYSVYTSTSIPPTNPLVTWYNVCTVFT